MKNSPGADDIHALLSLFNQGDYHTAEHHARELIVRFPADGFGWKVLGVVLKQQGYMTESLEAMRKAVELLPDDAEAHSNLGVTLMNQGQFTESVLSYRRALELKPDYIDVHHHLGLTLMSLMQWQVAAECFQHLLALNSDYPDADFNLGRAFQEQGQLSEAEDCYRRVLQKHPETANIHGHLAWVLHWQEKHHEAEASYQQALIINPQDVTAHSNLGLLLQTQGRLQEARQYYENALAIQSEFAEVHNNLGIVFHDLGLDKEAESCYQRALAIKADFSEAHNNLGLSLQAQGRLAEAEAAYRNALAIQSNNSEVYNNLGIVFQARRQLIEAQACYQRALRIHPDDAQVHNNLGAVYQDLGNTQQAEASFRRALAINPDFTEARSNLLFVMNYYGVHSTADYLTEARLYGSGIIKNKVDTLFDTWRCSEQPEYLRVGMVLGDLDNHGLGNLLNTFLPELDDDSIELIAYFTHIKTDQVTSPIQNYFSVNKSLVGLNDEQAATLIYDDDIHILLDLVGHGHYNRLPVFARKPAPIQISYLGFLASTGLDEMDYVLGDPYVTPQQDATHFSEKIWQLPESYCCFNAPDFDLEVNSLPALHTSNITFGCFDSINYLSDAVIALWARILNAVPYSRLLLKTEQLDNILVRQDIKQRFAEHGILPECLLLEGVSSNREQLAAYHRVDIALATFPHSDANSTIQALWMAVPVIGKTGDRFVTRRNESILSNAGLADWIAEDDEDYLAKAVYFAWDIVTLAELRAVLRQQLTDSPLFDAAGFARNFEAALWSMYLQ
jgi:protein O-GlcNAc transferase